MSEQDLWIAQYSCRPWTSRCLWEEYFAGVEKLLGAAVSHLDANDPVRRKFGDRNRAADYLVKFAANEVSRWVFGEVESLGVSFSVRLYQGDSPWSNKIDWTFPSTFLEERENRPTIRALFDLGNALLQCFYGYVDLENEITRKRKQSGSVDVRSELIGVFWLTYFGRQYVDFLGKAVIEELRGVDTSFGEGATLQLGQLPELVPDTLRRNTERALNEHLFVVPGDQTTKRPGQYALNFDQLRS